MLTNGEKLIIAGPCTAESTEQVNLAVQQLKGLDIHGMRAGIWKPRTRPGFAGLGEEGIDLLKMIVRAGKVAATEVMLPSHAEVLVERLVRKYPEREFVFWIGARNQNHMLQYEISKVLKNERTVYLMIKNQMWRSEKHWLGIYEHVTAAGFPAERMLICHRGFAPHDHNPRNLKNIPDFAMAMRVKQLTGRPMILDPSHIGGETNKVLEILKEAKQYDFDGYMIEVHPNPREALVDAAQQLTVEQLKQVLHEIN